MLSYGKSAFSFWEADSACRDMVGIDVPNRASGKERIMAMPTQGLLVISGY
jgi:hypothetical protein